MPIEALVCTEGEVGEHGVELGIDFPEVEVEGLGDLGRDALFESVDAAAFPDLVGEDDEEVFEGEAGFVPITVVEGKAGKVKVDALLDQEGITRGFVLAAFVEELGRDGDFADVVGGCAKKDVIAFEGEGGPLFLELAGDLQGGIKHKGEVSGEEGRGCHVLEEALDGHREFF